MDNQIVVTLSLFDAQEIMRSLTQVIDQFTAERWLKQGPGAIEQEVNQNSNEPWGQHLRSILVFAQAIGFTERDIISFRFGQMVMIEEEVQADKELGILWTDSSSASSLYCWDLSVEGRKVSMSKSKGFGHEIETPLDPVAGTDAPILLPLLQRVAELRQEPVYFIWGELGLMKVTSDNIVFAIPEEGRDESRNYLAKYLNK